jgi:uncharacterized membrane protein
VNVVHTEACAVDGLIFLAVILIIALLAIPVGVIVLFIRTAAMRDRIERLERALSHRPVAVGPAAPETIMAEPIPEPDASAPADLPATDMPQPLAADSETSPWDRAISKGKPAALRVTGQTDITPTAQKALPETPPQDGPIVFREGQMDALLTWVKTNWIYLISAASLGLAGIFFVQYGMERGLLPPGLRVLAAIAFGAGLIGAGEWLRRRHGDEGETTTIYLPSVFSGAGLVSIFAAVLSARHLYGLIGPETAFAGLLATGVLAMVLGWFYGPVLAAVGLIGAALAPFLVAGGSDAEPWLYAYFAVITATGLGIDAIRRWAWVSVLALALGFLGAFISYAAGAGELGWTLMMITLALMAAIIPPLALTPRHEGPSTLHTLLGQSAGAWPGFPTRLAAGAALAASLGLLLLDAPWVAPLLAPCAMALLALAYLVWAKDAPGLADLSLLPAAGFVIWLLMQGAGGEAFWAFQALAIEYRAPETAGPLTMTWLVGLAAMISLFAYLRAVRQEGRVENLTFGLMAVLVAPAAVAILELMWSPAQVIGVPVWAAHIVAVAALMTWFATRFAARDAGDMRRTAYAVLSGLALAALALFVMTTATALTLALAVLLVVAAALDRRFNLPEMGLFQQIGVAVLSWRLLVDPGLQFAIEGPLGAVILAFAGSIGALAAARWMAKDRPLTEAVLESAAAALAAVFASVLVTRLVLPDTQYPFEGHWQATLLALPWLILMGVQLYRAEVGGWMANLRRGLAALAGLVSGGWLFAAVIPFNPLFNRNPDDLTGLVQGPLLINSLFVAYALPGLLLLLMRPYMPQVARVGFLGLGSAFLALYGVLEIRHWFQGDWLGVRGVAQGELYSYTLALMALGAGLLLQSIRKGSTLLRRMAMAVIGVTIAKVFLLDAAGLTGLTRVFSFLGLGLSLAGLAWLNRWAERAAREQ